VNPEYSANPGSQSAPKADYFVEDYRPTGVNGNLNGNYSSNSPNSAYSYYNNNPYAFSPYSVYGNAGWGYPMGMGGMYPMDMYGMRGYGYPYGSGWSMSMSYGMGFGYNPWMYGGMNSMMMSYGSYWPSSYYGYGMYDPFMMSSMYCPYSFYGYNSPYSSYYYPGTVVDNNTINGRNVAYGRRAERSSTEGYQPSDDTRQAVSTSRTGRALSNARTRSAEGTQAYYERGWKNNTHADGNSSRGTTRSFWSTQNQGSANNSSSGDTDRWNNSGRSGNSLWNSWDNNSNSNSNSGSSWSTGGGTRSSWSSGGTSSGGGGGGGRTSSGGTRGRD
jgi:uncharacterized membrane protein YgcG